jgi:phenylpropionate dioxygenase-like ring-hydroxylating dioxygenase large terminal subunit
VGLLKALSKIRGGYPGGWKEYARGYHGNDTPTFVQPNDPDDRRSQIPANGLREYWYPAIPDKDIGWKKPVGLRIVNQDITLFRDKNDHVQALWDYCPHRGVYLSWGDCFWKGYLSCAYHGATFNGDGECVEFITEGPDSKMVGQLKAKKFPTVTLRGLVFVWMGEGDPVPPEEDIPPEFFEPQTMVQWAFRYWACNWMIALENTGDAHNRFYVHRDSFRLLRSRLGGRPRTPMGLRVKIVNDKSVNRAERQVRNMFSVDPDEKDDHPERYYVKDNKLNYQFHHPRVDGHWPLHRWRLIWTWFFDIFERRKAKQPRYHNPPEWEGQRLPGMVRNNHHTHLYTRWAVPVDKDLTRAVYFFTSRPKNWIGRLYDKVTYTLFINWMVHFNFSDQDYDAMRSARYQYPEYLSSSDNPVIALRRLVGQRARGIKSGVDVVEETTAERLVREADEQMGVLPDASSG